VCVLYICTSIYVSNCFLYIIYAALLMVIYRWFIFFSPSLLNFLFLSRESIFSFSLVPWPFLTTQLNNFKYLVRKLFAPNPYIATLFALLLLHCYSLCFPNLSRRLDLLSLQNISFHLIVILVSLLKKGEAPAHDMSCLLNTARTMYHIRFILVCDGSRICKYSYKCTKEQTF
jgi:hypothetical protein